MGKCTGKPLTAQAVEKALEEHDRLIHAFIRRQGGGDIPYEEALQAGRIGLWYAIEGYDSTRGTAFSTYAWVAICHQIHRRVKELKRETDVWSEEGQHHGLCRILPGNWRANSDRRSCSIWWVSFPNVYGK